jgi:hypothetical protein
VVVQSASLVARLARLCPQFIRSRIVQYEVDKHSKYVLMTVVLRDVVPPLVQFLKSAASKDAYDAFLLVLLSTLTLLL